MFNYIKQKKQEAPVYLNVYNFWSRPNKCCSCLGLGVYHTAIEIQGIQYMYYGFDGDETGVIQIQPKSASYQFAQQILLGYMSFSYYQLQTQILDPLRLQFLGNRYDLLNNNCNHFALKMSQMLGVSKSHPHGKIFRITNFFNRFRCCIPDCILNGRLDWFFKDEEQLKQMQDNYHEHISKQKSLLEMSQRISKSQYEQLVEQQEEIIKEERIKKIFKNRQEQTLRQKSQEGADKSDGK